MTTNPGLIQKIQERLSEELAEKVPADLAVEMKNEAPNLPKFPWLILQINVLADTLSIAASVATLATGVTYFLKPLIDIIRWTINFFWLWGKVSYLRRYIIKRAYWFIGMAIVRSFIPFSNLIYPVSITIVAAHNREKKAVQAFFIVAEEFSEYFKKDIKNLENLAGRKITRKARQRIGQRIARDVKTKAKSEVKKEAIRLTEKRIQKMAEERLGTAGKLASKQAFKKIKKDNDLDLRKAA